MSTRQWTPGAISTLSPNAARLLRDRLVTQARSGPTQTAREDAARLLLEVERRIGRDRPAAIERRADDARTFLGLKPSAAQLDAKRRAWDQACALYGEVGAKQRGYREPSEAA
jgi:hypothetical protein